MDIYHLLNPVPEPIYKRESTVLKAERRNIAGLPLRTLTLEPAPNNRKPQSSESPWSPRPRPDQPGIGVRPGRLSKAIAERTRRNFAGVRKSMQRSYTQEFKIEVLWWWLHPRMPQEVDEAKLGVLRAPLMREVSERYLVPITTLHNWRESQDTIISGRKGERKNRSRVEICS